MPVEENKLPGAWCGFAGWTCQELWLSPLLPSELSHPAKCPGIRERLAEAPLAVKSGCKSITYTLCAQMGGAFPFLEISYI